jgi:hypothetical protein
LLTVQRSGFKVKSKANSRTLLVGANPNAKIQSVGPWNPYMKLHMKRTANRSLRRAQAEWNIEQEISNNEVWNRFALTISD